jgi:hypothetical protein
VVILANSVAKRKRCIAGKDINTGEWIRIKNYNTDNSNDGFFPSYELKKLCGSEYGPKLLDVLDIAFSERIPLEHQPENMRIKYTKWVKQTIRIKSLNNLIDRPKDGWLVDNTSDKIHTSYFNNNKIDYSLVLLKLNENNNVKIEYTSKENYFRPMLVFNYNKINYNLPITYDKYPISSNKIPTKELKNVYVCIGLGEEYYGYHYKLVVGLIPYKIINR